MKPTVLLTGGFGNLGCRIAAEIHRSGDWNIRLATRSIRPSPHWAPAAEVISLDLRNAAEIEIACTEVSAIIHLAALNDLEAAVDPKLAELVSGAGTQLLVQAAARAGVNRFLFMSTAHVYGSPLTGTIDELSPTHCTHPYGTSHLSGELAVKQAHESGDLLGIRLRCANGFGFPLDPTVNIWHVLVNDLCNQVASSGSMTLRSSGLQERNFIPIADICSAFLHFLHLDVQSVGDGLFNLGGPKSMNVLEMAKVIAERSRTVLHIDPPINRPLQTEPEILISLDYRIDKLIASGFIPENNFNFELDHLLELSKRFVS